MSPNCVFELDRANGVYHTGDTVSGRIQLTTTEEKWVKKICVVFQGHAKVHWAEEKKIQSNNATEVVLENFEGSEKYIKSCNVVHDGGALPSGCHAYNFSIVLPSECPTSCMEEPGSISYELALALQKDSGFDEVFKHPITVIRALNLNLRPELLIPLKTESIRRLCFWPCTAGHFITTLVIPYGGYAPGQAIKYNVELDNQSKNRDLNIRVRLELIQKYKFLAHTPHDNSRKYVNKLADKEQLVSVATRTKRSFEGELLIPSVPPTSEHIGAVTVRYMLEVHIKTESSNLTRVFEIPIIIGTVPLAQSAIGYQPIIGEVACGGGGEGHVLPPGYAHFEPTSYQKQYIYCGELTDTGENDEKRYDGFLPKYPMFNNFAIQSNDNN